MKLIWEVWRCPNELPVNCVRVDQTAMDIDTTQFRFRICVWYHEWWKCKKFDHNKYIHIALLYRTYEIYYARQSVEAGRWWGHWDVANKDRLTTSQRTDGRYSATSRFDIYIYVYTYMCVVCIYAYTCTWNCLLFEILCKACHNISFHVLISRLVHYTFFPLSILTLSDSRPNITAQQYD